MISRAGQAILLPFHDLYHYAANWGTRPIAARVRELAASIDADMGDRPYVLLRLLDGAVPFASMLAEHLKSRPEVRSVKVSSYSGMESSGSVAWRRGLRRVPARRPRAGGG